MKRIVTIQDVSCVGKCSLTVALPIISAMGVETAIIPTAVLSTHTMFKGFTFRTNLNYDFQGSNSWSYTPVHIFTQEDFSANNAQDSFSTSGSARESA